MLQIAICDDQPHELELVTAFIKEYLSAHGLEGEVKLFTHPDALLTAIATTNFHLYILDVLMPMVSGIELGCEIRRFDHQAQILFVSTEPQFALQAYEASPINYLIKPVNKEKLFDALTIAISKIELSETPPFSVKTSEGLYVVKLSDIVCCEYQNHVAFFTLVNGKELVSRTFRENFSQYVAPISSDFHFLQCHASFLVNMKFVERFAKDSFTLRGGKTVPIAPRLYSAARDRYMDYLTKGVR